MNEKQINDFHEADMDRVFAQMYRIPSKKPAKIFYNGTEKEFAAFKAKVVKAVSFRESLQANDANPKPET